MSGPAEKISDSETAIMHIVWNANTPVTYTYIRKTLESEYHWDSSTINTLIKRLVKKGILAQEKKDVYYYSPAISESDYKQTKTKSFIQKVYNGNVKGLLSALVTYENVSKKDLEDLQKQWEDIKNQHE